LKGRGKKKGQKGFGTEGRESGDKTEKGKRWLLGFRPRENQGGLGEKKRVKKTPRFRGGGAKENLWNVGGGGNNELIS